MHCTKCGRETKDNAVFCKSCLAVMELYPVKPGTSIQLPQRAAAPKKATSRKKRLSPEGQVIRQRKTIRWLTVALICSILMLGLSIALLFDIMPEEEAKVTIGQNYVTRDTANHE
jgi:uncharacterized membrane protein YvbJ